MNNIFSKIKNFFATPATASSATMANTSVSTSYTPGATAPTPSKIFAKLKTIYKINLSSSNVIKYVARVIKYISRVFAGAIVLVVLAHFAPELRDIVPSLYKFVDFVMHILEVIASDVCRVLNL